MLNLTEHFKLSEFTYSPVAIENGLPEMKPTNKQVECLIRVATVLEALRARMSRPLHITSGFRTKELNDLIKGSPYSYHMRGCAADFVIRSENNPDLVDRRAMFAAFEYLRSYYVDSIRSVFIYINPGVNSTWIHLDVPDDVSETKAPLTAGYYVDGSFVPQININY